jgi:hypothetical protein
MHAAAALAAFLPPGDDFPVRLRFADLPAQGQGQPPKAERARYEAPLPRQVLERGLTTADLKARKDLKEKASVRPPDPDKLGEKQPSKQARAGTCAAAGTGNPICCLCGLLTRQGLCRVCNKEVRGGALGKDVHSAHEKWSAMGSARGARKATKP